MTTGEVEVEGEDKDHQQDASTTLSGNFAIGDVSLSNLKTNSGEVDSDGLSVLESDG
ncbi:9776_t:CDS:2 [Entrophospora sp. SA101]|nr:9776_t:CDS:2 [Entrophospora sp. SA101]